jgi:hypothetical protein
VILDQLVIDQVGEANHRVNTEHVDHLVEDLKVVHPVVVEGPSVSDPGHVKLLEPQESHQLKEGAQTQAEYQGYQHKSLQDVHRVVK